MNLEISLVKVKSIDAKMSRLASRTRVKVDNDTEALDQIAKFIADNISALSTVVSNKVFLNKLTNLTALTITELDCIRYYLSTSSGLDIWYYYVSDTESNGSDLPDGIFEYHIVDRNNMNGLFIPFVTKINQAHSENRLSNLYDQIIDMYGLFKSTLFDGVANPLMNIVTSIKSDENIVGTTSTTNTTYCNSIFEFLKKEIRVITN
jgi:hypothetical protein